ncbi:hypothetical protein RRG08_067244 [Elysia crispata]|uniref:Uncharacterized protein n=1 Tax=Elysia crispata TaxID=231223 RepID=A0AAE0ZH62_9GAST|nr:hypothetical protein RRG08_067244 [Elysia crispata]
MRRRFHILTEKMLYHQDRCWWCQEEKRKSLDITIWFLLYPVRGLVAVPGTIPLRQLVSLYDVPCSQRDIHWSSFHQHGDTGCLARHR